MVKHPSRSNTSSKLRRCIKKTKNVATNKITNKLKIKTKQSYNSGPKFIRLQSSSGINYYKKNKYKSIAGEKRMVIIDGANVAEYENRNIYSVEAIQTVLTYFINRGFDTKAVVSQCRMRKINNSNHTLIHALSKQGRLIITPGKTLPKSQPTSSYDRFILQIAIEFDAAIISNDRYTQLKDTNTKFKNIVDQQVIGYKFNNGEFQLLNASEAENLLNRRN